MQLEPRTPGLWVKRFTTKPRRNLFNEKYYFWPKNAQKVSLYLVLFCPPNHNNLHSQIKPFERYRGYLFLAHLSTTCSGGAIVTGHRPSSVRPSVRPSVCPSVNNFFKNLLLQNQKANLDKTWQECSLGEALQKLLKEFNSNKNSGCHGNKMAENGKNL